MAAATRGLPWGDSRVTVHPVMLILFNEGGLIYSQALETLSSVGQLIDAQIELNDFIGRSLDAFCYDDGIRFERCGQRLEIIEVDVSSRPAWHREGRKLKFLHSYWFYRALDDFLKSDAARERMGRPENEYGRSRWLRGYVRTLSDEARKFAEGRNVQLIDGTRLRALIKQAAGASQPYFPRVSRRICA